MTLLRKYCRFLLPGLVVVLASLVFFPNGAAARSNNTHIPERKREITSLFSHAQAQKRILWQRCIPDEKVQCDIWVMGMDGSNPTNLTPNTERFYEFDPQWSPDHTKIVFTSTRSGYPNIYTMNADGSEVKQLTGTADFKTFATFSPDGKRIVFSRAIDSKLQLHIMNVDGSGLRRLLTSDGVDEEPAFSPDGSKILFDSDRTGKFQLYVMNADGSGVTQLTTEPGENRYPSWSPDGKHFVYGSDRSGNWEIYSQPINGGNPVRLTDNPGNINSDPSWSSDGTSIVFASTRDGKEGGAEIYIMNADGSNQRRLTNDTSFDAGPFGW